MSCVSGVGEVRDLGSRKNLALTVVRTRAEQVLDFGGERGTRTLDLGIMSATL
jgi:hypothetical protein